MHPLDYRSGWAQAKKFINRMCARRPSVFIWACPARKIFFAIIVWDTIPEHTCQEVRQVQLCKEAFGFHLAPPGPGTFFATIVWKTMPAKTGQEIYNMQFCKEAFGLHLGLPGPKAFVASMLWGN